MTNIFTYGTLMYPEVIFGLTKAKYSFQKAVLQGHIRRQVRSACYPGVIKAKEGNVQGIIYYDLSPQDVDRLHRFEGDQYIPTAVTVKTEKGDQNAILYLYRNAGNLEEKEWDFKYFENQHLTFFANARGS